MPTPLPFPFTSPAPPATRVRPPSSSICPDADDVVPSSFSPPMLKRFLLSSSLSSSLSFSSSSFLSVLLRPCRTAAMSAASSPGGGRDQVRLPEVKEMAEDNEMSEMEDENKKKKKKKKKKGRLRGVVFDMDGTLTVPVIDFTAMYCAVLGEEGYLARRDRSGSIDILHQIESWQPPEQRRAYEIIAEYERQGLNRLQIMPGALELCGYLDSRQIKRGLITRNVKAAVDLFHQRFGVEFFPALSREFLPYKPDPAPLLHICSVWGIPPNEVLMIGDSLRDDVGCGKRAGSFTCLLDETGRYDSINSIDEDLKPDFTVSSLSQVFTLLENHFIVP